MNLLGAAVGVLTYGSSGHTSRVFPVVVRGSAPVGARLDAVTKSKQGISMTDTFPGATAAYTVAECLVRLKLSRDKFYQEIRAGRLRARKLGRRTLILDSDLRAFLESLPRLGGDR
jgi:excisionase family DNA binding protein